MCLFALSGNMVGRAVWWRRRWCDDAVPRLCCFCFCIDCYSCCYYCLRACIQAHMYISTYIPTCNCHSSWIHALVVVGVVAAAFLLGIFTTNCSCCLSMLLSFVVGYYCAYKYHGYCCCCFCCLQSPPLTVHYQNVPIKVQWHCILCQRREHLVRLRSLFSCFVSAIAAVVAVGFVVSAACIVCSCNS